MKVCERVWFFVRGKDTGEREAVEVKEFWRQKGESMMRGGSEMEPKIGRRGPLEPEDSHKRFHEGQRMRRRGRQMGPRDVESTCK